MRTALSVVAVLTLSSAAVADDYTLKISKIEMKKTPQSGDWCAGVSVYQTSEPDNRDSWHGGENKFEGPDASLPVQLELGGLKSGERVSVFFGLDDDAEDAGGEKAEDKITVTFKVFPTASKDRVYDFSSGKWSIRIHYSVAK